MEDLYPAPADGTPTPSSAGGKQLDVSKMDSGCGSVMHDVQRRVKRTISRPPKYPAQVLPKAALVMRPETAAAFAVANCGQGRGVEHEPRAPRPREWPCHISFAAVMYLVASCLLLLLGSMLLVEHSWSELPKVSSGNLGLSEHHDDSGPRATGPADSTPAAAIADMALQAYSSKHRLGAVFSQQSEEAVALGRDGAGGVVPCSPEGHGGCLQARVVSFRRQGEEEEVRVLVVAPPGGSAEAPEPSGRRFLRRVRMGLSASLVALAAITVLGIHYLVWHPLRRLASVAERLGSMDSDEDLLQLRGVHLGPRSCIQEVASAQQGIECFANCLETFGRFMPLPLVRSIALGSERRMRLSVSSQDVTIMFLCVQDFESICEALPERDVLFIVMCYQSIMVQIVELYQGTVTEILDDGLLAFWNAPDSVADHAAKACLAAVAQMQAAAQLNEQLAGLGMPQLSFSIGLHTGQVLSGTVGSETRMKFGCMGDSVNLTSRLMGLCRYFGVGTVCSAETRRALAPAAGLLLRRLGEVRVKGRKEPTTVYELFGHDDGADGASDFGASQGPQAASPPYCQLPDATGDLEAGSEGPGVSLARRRDGAWRYEQALDAFLGRRFEEARERVLALLEVSPGDVAAAKLLDRIGQCLDCGECGALSEAEQVKWTGVLQMHDK